MSNPDNPQPPDDTPALGDLLAQSDLPVEPFEVVEHTEEKPKRKRKRRFFLPNIGLYASVAGVAAFTTLLVAGIVLLAVGPRLIVPSTVTPPYPTPPGYYDPSYWDWNTPLYTTDLVGNIPANSLVRIQSMYYDTTQLVWYYTVANIETGQEGTAYEWQLIPPPQPTPTLFPFSQAIGMGYMLITTEPVGAIPANTRVRISHITTDAQGWLYVIVTEDEDATADARSWQISYAPDVTIGVTPTSALFSLVNIGQFDVVTLVQIGDIPANSLVALGSGWFNGHEWSYSISTRDGQFAENALESQLAFGNSGLPSPTPPPTPTL